MDKKRKRNPGLRNRRRIQRWISILAVLVLCVTGIDLSAFGMASAEEKSGYVLTLEYTGDATGATIRGDATKVSPDIELIQLADQQGTVHDATNFIYEVTENGRYSFVLTYRKNVNDTTTEHQETLSVDVTDIAQNTEVQDSSTIKETPKATEEKSSVNEVTEDLPVLEEESDNSATPENPEEESDNSATPENPEDEGMDTVQKEITDSIPSDNGESKQVPNDENGDGFPESLPVETLKRSAAQLAGIGNSRSVDGTTLASGNGPTIDARAVTKENQITLTEAGENGIIKFAGGEFSEDTVSIKQYNQQRIFSRALFFSQGAQYEIGALYPYSNGAGEIAWYYVLKEEQNTASSSGGNSDQGYDIGFELQKDADLILEYDLDSKAPKYNIEVSGKGITGSDSGYWDVNVLAQAKHREKVVLEFNVPSAYKGATVAVKKNSDNTVIQTFRTGDDIGKPGDTLMDSVDSLMRRYSGVFEMPADDITIEITEVTFSTKAVRYYGIGTDGQDTDALESSFAMAIEMKGLTRQTPSLSHQLFKLNGSVYAGTKEASYKDGVGSVSVEDSTSTYYNLDGSPSTMRRVAWGQFEVGEDVELEISYAAFQKLPDMNWKKIPAQLRIDTYPKTVKNQYEENGMVSEIVDLPKSAGEKMTATLMSGAIVEVECTKYEGNISNVAGSTYPQASGEACWYAYKVTVKNMQYAFKAYLNGDSTAQSSTLIEAKDAGIVFGSGSCDVASRTQNEDMSQFLLDHAESSNLKGSFFVGSKDEEKEDFRRYAYPLSESQALWSKWGRAPDLSQKKEGYYEFYIQAKSGYSRPELLTKSGTAEFKEIRNGYFYYTYQGSQYPGLINISTKPITFTMKYRDGKIGNVIYTDPDKYTPATNKEYIIKNVVLTSPDSDGDYFQGYKIDAVLPNGKQQVIDDNKLYSAGDVVDLQELHQKMFEGGFIDGRTEYELRLRGVWGKRENGSQVPAIYNVTTQKQTAFALAKDSTSSNIEELSKNYPDPMFERKENKDINGYFDLPAKLVGYKTQYIDENTHYKYMLSPDSITNGKVTEQAFAELVYMYAVNVEFAVNDGGFEKSYGSNSSFGKSEGELAKYNASIAERYYIPAEERYISGGKNQTGKRYWALELFDESGSVSANYNPGTITGKRFVGWKIQNSTSKELIIDANTKWLNVYDIALNHPDLWANAVKAGKIVLEPVWEDQMGRITADGTNLNGDTQNQKVTSGKQYQFTNTFKYSGAWDTSGFSYALREKRQDGTYDVWYSSIKGNATSGKDGVKISAQNDDGQKSVALTVTIPESLVTKAILNGHTLTLSAWNSKNNVTNTDLETSQLGAAARYDNSFTVIPQAIEVIQPATETVSTSERMGYAVSAQFKFDNLYYSEQEMKDTVEGLSYAVYYKNQDGQIVTRWSKEDGNTIQTSASGPNVALDDVSIKGDIVTLTFWIGNTADQSGSDAEKKNSKSIDMHHDNTHYYIACWNKTNGDYTIEQALQQITSSKNTIPYKDITNKVVWRDPDYYVTIPATILLEEDEGKSDEYAGKKVEIAFNSNTSDESTEAQGPYKVPDIKVEIQGDVNLKKDGNGAEQKPVLICNKETGDPISSSGGNYDLGTLSYKNRSVSVWMNTLKEKERDQKWSGTATFKLTNTSAYPSSVITLNDGEVTTSSGF